jgi:predicted dithiol-disulfide oxidoreductase (DUF899 family)
MMSHKIISQAEWVAARKDLLAREKEFTRQRDELSRRRRELPWVKVEKNYIFDGPEGKETLADLFGERSQLIVYHFMFDPEWSQGCKSCSFLADHYNPAIVHLNHRDVSMVTVSRAPINKLLAFRERMRWTFKWVSSFESDFNRDFHVTFTEEEQSRGNTNYNYEMKPFPVTEAPGMSVFFKDEAGNIFHTYSSYARGLDIFIGAYNLLDIVPKGRDEEGVPTMSWLRHHDRYDDTTFVDPWLERAAGSSKS